MATVLDRTADRLRVMVMDSRDEMGREAARQADERAKEQNAQRQAMAQRDWEAARQQRLPELEREMQSYGQEFTARRRQLDDHMRRLEGMDALCEEDKNLQTVELLIRLMETRRADSVKEALAGTQQTSDIEEIKSLYSTVDKKVQEDVPMFSAYVISAQGAVSKRITGAAPSVYGLFNDVQNWDVVE